MPTPEQIESNFAYRAPQMEKHPRYQVMHDRAKELALLITEITPTSREQSLALTKLEETVMWANAAIARNEG